MVIKKSFATDNGKHITLFDAQEYIDDEQRLEYLYYKYLAYLNEYNTDVYFVPYYDIKKEFRLYYIKDPDTKQYKICSAKQKINLTSKEELLVKTKIQTGGEMKVRWELLDKDTIPKKLQQYAKYVMQKNKIDIGVIEFVKTTDNEYRFLEINCL